MPTNILNDFQDPSQKGDGFFIGGEMSFTPGEFAAFIIGALGLILTILNIRDKLNAIKKEEDQPIQDLKKKVEELEERLIRAEEEISRYRDMFNDQEETNVTFRSVMLSFVNFEIAYCLHTGFEHTEELMRAKDELEKYLAGRKKQTNKRGS